MYYVVLTLLRNSSTIICKASVFLDRSTATSSVVFEDCPVSPAAVCTPIMFDETSRVAADCSSTAPEIAVLISLTFVITLVIILIAAAVV